MQSEYHRREMTTYVQRSSCNDPVDRFNRVVIDGEFWGCRQTSTPTEMGLTNFDQSFLSSLSDTDSNPMGAFIDSDGDDENEYNDDDEAYDIDDTVNKINSARF